MLTEAVSAVETVMGSSLLSTTNMGRNMMLQPQASIWPQERVIFDIQGRQHLIRQPHPMSSPCRHAAMSVPIGPATHTEKSLNNYTGHVPCHLPHQVHRGRIIADAVTSKP